MEILGRRTFVMWWQEASLSVILEPQCYQWVGTRDQWLDGRSLGENLDFWNMHDDGIGWLGPQKPNL